MLGRACLLAGGALWLMGSGGCGTPNDYSNLFDSSPSQAGRVGAAGSLGTSGGSESAAGAGSGGVNVAGGTGSAGSGGGGAGCAFSCGDAGRGGGSLGGAGSGGASEQAGSGPALTECSALDPNAAYLPSTQHCYLVVTEQRTFTAAQTYCKSLGAHLVTLVDEAEDQFAWTLHPEEHWIGSKDGNAPKDSKVGTYSWLTGEPFEYSNWSSNQPNASATECGENNGGGTCYEHCAFQWTGGEHDGQWNDRYCQHTIASVCEWDDTP